jgi:hypothetical protein
MSSLDTITVKSANLAWKTFQAVNRRIPEGKHFHPKWAPEPLQKSYQRSMPPLGFPRETDSLCPDCVKEVRQAVIDGELDISKVTNGHPAEIKAQLLEEDNRIIIRKTCPRHGSFEDILSMDAEFSHVVESRFYGRDYQPSGDTKIHHHGTSNVKSLQYDV